MWQLLWISNSFNVIHAEVKFVIFCRDYNLKENELREIEKVEESFLSQLLCQVKGGSISQLYLECGIYPALFEIIKMRLLFLQDILHQDTESLLHRFLEAQSIEPSKGCWANQVVSDLDIYQYLQCHFMIYLQCRNISLEVW